MYGDKCAFNNPVFGASEKENKKREKGYFIDDDGSPVVLDYQRRK